MNRELRKAEVPPQRLRKLYLESLGEAQELFLEELVSKGDVWILDDDAYAVTSCGSLVEFYVSDSVLEDAIPFFDQVLEVSGVSSVLIKSFDRHMLYAALSRPARIETAGLMFRSIHDSTCTHLAGLDIRPARHEDIDTIWSFNDGFFSGTDEVSGYLMREGLFVLETDAGVVGCGIVTEIVSGCNDMDIGMLVASEHRRKGYGTYIVSFLKDFLLKKGRRPVCGCSVDNPVSAKTLAKAGFVCEHRLLKVVY